MKITLELSEDVEGTECPYWLIVDPKQNMCLNLDRAADQVTGPFFSREAATNHLKARSHAFSKRARVYCHSGYYSREYRDAIRTSRQNKQMGLLEKIFTYFD